VQRFWVLIGAATVLGLAVPACRDADGETAQGSNPGADRQLRSATESGARVVNVEVTAVVPTEFSDVIRATGEVEALNDVTLSAEEAGVIVRLFRDKGAEVERGDPLLKIDDAVLIAQVNEARAAAQVAGEQYERQRRVWEEEKIGSEIGLLQAKSAAEGAAARLAALETRLGRTVIRAPVHGVFDERRVEVGEMVSPGMPVGRVVSVHRLKVTAGIPERFAADLRSGARARLTFDVFPGRQFEGRVSFVGSTVNTENRTFPVEIALENPGRVIKPHMVANVQVERARLQDVVVVDQDVVMRTENGYQVFVIVERDGVPVAQARPVVLGPSNENYVVVREGLATGDRVVTAGQRLVDHGSRVRIVNAERVR
jgi:RND family efflux transporter MFP subunit